MNQIVDLSSDDQFFKAPVHHIIGMMNKKDIKISKLSIPRKRSFFENQKSNILSDLDEILYGQYLSTLGNEISSTCQLIASSDECIDFHQTIKGIIQEYANNIPNNLDSASDFIEIGEKWNEIMSRINYLEGIFSGLCLHEFHLNNFKSIFLETVHDIFINENDVQNSTIFTNVSKKIIEGYLQIQNNNNSNSNNEKHSEILIEKSSQLQMAFNFVLDSKLCDSRFNPLLISQIIQNITPTIEEYIHQLKLSDYLKKSVQLIEEQVSDLFQYITPLSCQKLKIALSKLIFSSHFDDICENGLKILIQERDLSSIQTCVDLARQTDTIQKFTRELSFVFESEVADCFKLNNPIQGILILHKTLMEFSKSFSNTEVKVLHVAFEKGLNVSPETAARLLAVEINREFIQSSKEFTQNSKLNLEPLIAVFRMLSCKDTFAAFHASMLSRRVLMMKEHILHIDQQFADELLKQCGSDYARPFLNIFEDVNTSNEVMKTFIQEKNPPSWFSAFITNKESWPRFEIPELPPPIKVLPSLKVFQEFYIQKEKRKLTWIGELSRVKLSVKNVPGLKTIKCSGAVATVILQFHNNTSRTLKQISEMIGGVNEQDKKTITDILNFLSEDSCGNLIKIENQCYSINTKKKMEKEVLSILFNFPKMAEVHDEFAANSVSQNRDFQIDAAIMAVMKKERSMDREALKEDIKERLFFRLDSALYDKRLAALVVKTYLKQDASGIVHYIP